MRARTQHRFGKIEAMPHGSLHTTAMQVVHRMNAPGHWTPPERHELKLSLVDNLARYSHLRFELSRNERARNGRTGLHETPNNTSISGFGQEMRLCVRFWSSALWPCWQVHPRRISQTPPAK